MFECGDKVYHKNRKESGIFIEYDKLDTDTATVFFPNDYGGDYARITYSLLVKEESK